MAFRAPIKVCFSDIDYAGIVYYPRFLHYFHVAMEDFFGSELGMDYPKVLIDHRIGFPTVHLETDFSKPLNWIRAMALSGAGTTTFSTGLAASTGEKASNSVARTVTTSMAVAICTWPLTLPAYMGRV